MSDTNERILEVEGLAAQLYTRHAYGRSEAFVWWHLVRGEVKTKFRKEAAKQISDFHARNDIPEHLIEGRP